MKKQTLPWLAFLFLLFSFSSPLFAQNIPPSNQASVIEEKIRQETERKLEKRKVTPEIEEEAEAPKAPAEKETPFTVRTITLEGNTWISSARLAPLLEPYLNREIKLSDLKKLSTAIEDEYRKHGFIATYVYIPPQEIENAAVILKVIEGKIGTVTVEGNRWFRKNRTLEYSQLKTGDAVRYGDLWESLFQMNQNPDRSVRAVLKRGKEPETTDLIYSTKDNFPLHAAFSFDNQGNRPTGKKEYGFNVRDNNLFTMDDVLSGGVVFGSHFGVVYSQYLFPIPQTHTNVIFGYSHAQVAPKKESEPFGTNSIADTYYLKLQQALLSGTLMNASYRLGMDLGFEFKNSRTKLLSEPFRKDKIRILRFGPTLQVVDKWGMTDFMNGFAFGINGLGADIFASPDAARQGLKPNFFYYRGDFSRAQTMPWETRLNLHFSPQIAGDKLPSSEELYMGGANSVRGYPEGDYLADDGFILNIEYLVPLFFVPSRYQLPFAQIPISKQIQIVTFYDQGYGRLRSPSERERDARNMIGVGAGLRVHLYRNLYARTEWAQPVGDSALTETTKGRFHFRLQAEI